VPPISEPYRTVVDVMLILVDGDSVLLALRDGTGYADGLWNLPSGKLEAGEDVVRAVIREAREEVGLCIGPEEVRMVVALHHRNPGGAARVGFFFEVASDPDRQGEPVNAEPGKCDGLAWFPMDRLPPATVPYTAAGVDLYRRGIGFGLHGWDASLEGPSSQQEWGQAARSPRA
jgi:8-oxo-dGTP diphosphatase